MARFAPGGSCPLAVPDVWALWGRLSRYVPWVGFFLSNSLPPGRTPHNAGFASFVRNFFCFEAAHIMEQPAPQIAGAGAQCSDREGLMDHSEKGRRDFLKSLALGAAGAAMLLAGC